MYNILSLNNISKTGLEIFSDKYVFGNNIKNPDAILLRSQSLHDLEFNDNLIAIARAGSGVNNIPVKKCSENGIVVFNTPGANANAVKELVLAGLFLSSRNIIEGFCWLKSLSNPNDSLKALIEEQKKKYVGPEIFGKKLGVIGLGSIGTLVANSAKQLGMKVSGFDPYTGKKSKLLDGIDIKDSLGSLLNDCDYVTLHVPLNEKTTNMIDSSAFLKMKTGCRLLNFARQELVNSNDLLKAIDNKKICCYVTDFPTPEMLNHPGVISLPHLGASTPEAEENCSRMAIKQLIDYIENGNIKNSVNFPNINSERNGMARLCLLYHSVDNTEKFVNEILSILHTDVQNIKSNLKGSYSYTILDLSQSITKPEFLKLNHMQNIVKVRIIK